MACKQPAPVMAHRKRPGTSGSSCSMVVPPVRPLCPATYPPEQHDQEHEEGPGEEEEVHYCRQQGLEPELTDSRPATPTTPDLEHEHEHSHDHDHPDCHDHDDHSHSDDHAECHGLEHADCQGHGHSHDDVDCHNHGHVHSHINDHDHAGCHGHRHDHADSLDGDSSSDYVNNTSEEEDYDEGLPEEDEGVTYYIRYCPEDDSYLEGSMDCNEAEADYTASTVQHIRAEPPGDTDECQEVVEEWAEGEGGVEVGEVRSEVVEQDLDEQIYNVLDHHTHPAAVLHESPPPTEEEEEEERAGVAYTGPYYGPEEDNGNSMVHIPRSPYRGRKVVVEGETGEEAEEDIDQIVAEIKMSMSMGSLSSGGTDQSPDELVQDSVPSDYHPPEAHAKPEPAPYTPTPHRHDSRPKSLNLPSSTRHNNPELQKGFKVRSRTPEERHQWAQEQMTNGAEQPRKQQRSDLNVPLENNNVPEETKKAASFPSFVDVPGPCEPEDLIDGIIFAANYLGSTQLLSERNPSKNIRMMQAQEAVSRVKSPEGDAQTLTEVDLFISTLRIKVLNADTQETMMDNALRTISYIADIGNIVVLMARRRMPRTASQDCIETTPGAPEAKKQYRMICHVFESEDAQLIAQSIGQSFSVAYQEFLRANGINPEDLSQKEYSDIINTQEMYNDDLIHFSNSENCKELQLEKHKGEILGVVIVESGWGSILPTVILANMMNGGPAARSGKLSIGDQIMSINNTSLVGLPLATCQGIIKGLKNQVQVKLNIVSCPPVTTVLIKRPDLKYQLGFSVQNGIICSLMRGGIAERGGVRVGHRIIEINGQSVVATAHEKIVQALSNSVGEIHMKTMPAAMFRLLTGQETPMYI
ncbi:amyloid-beta A4 precursor protein-binding family A member 2-like isoform X2 [Oncorhynchus tshawytscha]|uniref:Amyloid beta (A4) precursor protein-binding, family A, member 2b n=1 Tax=Oncorhynchus tshawytscha TaxID=74940 RepID=A0A8C8JAM1_ONCTS|nr:amyloid-beta A4 precursor protein-binding family A member 2-like isoform X2 [Oncorhynchus tshawytscha]